MRKAKARCFFIITTFLSILFVVVFATTGCAPKIAPLEGPDVSALLLTNVTTSAYDAVPLTWKVGKNTLESTGTVVLHANNPDGTVGLYWLPPTPATTIEVVQQWGFKDKLPLLTTKAQNALNIYTPPGGMQYQPATSGLSALPFVRWYVADAVAGESFLTTQSEIIQPSSQTALDGTILTVTEKSLWQTAVPTPKTLTLSVAVPAGLAHMVILYGSGSTESGFVVVEASPANAPNNTPDSIWLLRMNSGVGSWVDCGKLSVLFGGNIFSDQWPSFARVGPLLYFTHSFGKIGCIDTAAVLPSITVPENINAFLAKLREGAPKNAEYPIQAQLANDNGTLIIEYPDVNWNGIYYAVDAAGIMLGSLRADKTSMTSFDANGKQGSSLKRAPGYVSLPSIDLFQTNIF